jgi:ATP synthase protein I
MTSVGGPRKSPWRLAGELTAIAFEFTGAIAGGVLAGTLADRWLGTEPWLLVLGAVAGSCVGFYEMLRMVRLFQKDA